MTAAAMDIGLLLKYRQKQTHREKLLLQTSIEPKTSTCKSQDRAYNDMGLVPKLP